MYKDNNESATTRSDANKLFSKTQSFEFVVMVIWDKYILADEHCNQDSSISKL